MNSGSRSKLSCRRTLALCLTVLLSLESLAGGTQSQGNRRLKFEDSETLKQTNYLQMSPNGETLAYVLDGDIWVISTQHGSVPLKLGEGSVPIWSKDSKRLAYYKGNSGTLQLWVLNFETKEAQQITHFEGGINPDLHTRLLGWFYDPLLFSWSPDGTKIAFASQVSVDTLSSSEPQSRSPASNSADEAEGPLVLTTKTPSNWTLDGIFSHGVGNQRWVKGMITRVPDSQPAHATMMVSQLFIVDLNRKQVEQLTKDQAVYFNPDWSPDGQKILCASSEGRSLAGYGSGTTNIYAIEVSTGKKSVLTAGAGDKRLPAWSPDGQSIAYLGGEHFGIQSVFVTAGAAGKPINVTSKTDRYIRDFHWSASSNAILVSLTDGVSNVIANVDIRTGHLQKVAGDEPAYRWPMTVSNVGTIAWQQSDASHMGVICILQFGANSADTVVDLNPQINEWQLGRQEIVRWKNHHGHDLEGILIKPVGYQEGRRYPLIVDCYPGVQNSFFAYPLSGNQELASRGYAIFYPDARTPYTWMNPFKTEAYDRAAKGPDGWEVTVDDIMSGVDELIRRGVVDPERMGLLGFSSGAGVVNYLVTRTGRFKCAVSVAPVLTDWSRSVFLDTMNPMIPTIAGVSPWEKPDAYIQLSAIYHIDEVSTPMLLANGDNDVECLLNAIEIYNGLRWFGRNVTFLRYAGQGHGFTGEAGKDFWWRMNAFFDRYLKPEE